MNILIASSEVAPLAKTGGLADVCGALPLELAQLGQQVAVIMPAYRDALRSKLPLEPLDLQFDVPIGSKIVPGRLLRTYLPNSSVPVYLVAQDHYYDRAGLYGENGQDYRDNCERFVFFCRACMEAIRLLDLRPDVLHVNDWQTSLIPAYLNVEYARTPGYEQTASLLTIHNMAYQGRFWHWDMLLTGLDWKYFNWRQMEFFDQLNLLKTGIVFADAINTVSPSYAREIQAQPHGSGLEDVLRQKRDVLSGIINGVDYRTWDPATDAHLPARYDLRNWSEGKAQCKQAIQQELGLPVNPNAPLIGIIGRLADQKGWDLIARVIQKWVQESDAQWAILGMGDLKYHELLSRLAKGWSSKIAARLEFSEPLAHRIEGGADLFLMPSRYEPCGLNQLYSLKYGCVPVVRETGGLADTIVDATPEALASGTANGFSFGPYDADELDLTLRRAVDMYTQHPELWKQLVETGMRQDWSWTASARQYIALYEAICRRRQDQSRAATY